MKAHEKEVFARKLGFTSFEGMKKSEAGTYGVRGVWVSGKTIAEALEKALAGKEKARR